jgi:hypothetical protein
MPVEIAQLLSTAHHILDKEKAIPGIYKATHANHPCAVWVRESAQNYVWALSLGRHLVLEYLRRYGRYNASCGKPMPKVIDTLDNLRTLPQNIKITNNVYFSMHRVGGPKYWTDPFNDPCPILPDVFARALPETYNHVEDTIRAYRQFYIYDKYHLAQWYVKTGRNTIEPLPKPYWFPELI